MTRASVVVVSRHRLAELELCLAGLTLQDHPNFEIILVADGGSIAARPDLPLKRAVFDTPNIARARNIGLQLVAGDVVAFIDDDAVPGPGWLSAITAPFADSSVDQAAGYTHGPDGIGWQVRAERIGRDGRTQILADAPPSTQAAASLYPADPDWPISTIGTNCAFRYETLAAVGGFDPDFAFHLDESDVNLRISQAFPNGKSAVCPAARVIHGMAPSDHRARRRVPRSLNAVGRSHAIFARRHGGKTNWLHDAQRRRLLRLMRGGAIDSLFIPKLLATLRDGLRDGASCTLNNCSALRNFNDARKLVSFLPVHSYPEGCSQMPRLIIGWFWRGSHLRRLAVKLAGSGQPVEIVLLSPSFMPHFRRFSSEGYWERKGGAWGRLCAGGVRAQVRSLKKLRDILWAFSP